DIEDVIGELRQGKLPSPGMTEMKATPPVTPETPKRKFDFAGPTPKSPPQPAPRTESKKDVLPSKSSPISATLPNGFRDAFIQRAEDRSATTAVYLKKADRIDRTADRVEIVMPTSTYLSGIDTKEHRAVIDAVASELVGQPVSVSLILKG